jgi:surface protein
MSGFFYKNSLATRLEKIDMGNLDTSDTTDFSKLYYNLSYLTDLNMSNLNTSKVTTIESAFYGCKKLETLDLTNWDFSSVDTVTSAFGSCSSLKTIYVSSDFSAPSVPTSYPTQSMVFYGCTNLSSPTMSYSSSYTNSTYFSITKGYLTPVDASGVAAISEHSHELSPMINMIEMYNNKGLEWEAFINNENSLPTKLIFTKTIPPEDVECFDLSANSDKSVLCWIVNEDEYRYIYVAEKDGGIIEAPEDMGYFFSVFDGIGLYTAHTLTAIDIEEESLNTSSVINMGMACGDLSALKEFTFKNLNTSNVCSFMKMFAGCTSLEKIDFENFSVGVGSLYSSYKENLVPKGSERVQTLASNVYEIMNDFYREIYTEEQMTAMFGQNAVFTDEEKQAAGLETASQDFYPYYLITEDKTYLPETIPGYYFILFDGMFCNCTSLTELVNVENFKVGSNSSIRYSLGSPYGLYFGDNSKGLFESCSSLKEISLPNVDFRYIFGCYHLFYDCTSLEKIYTDHDWSLSYTYEPIGYTEYGVLPDTFSGVTEENNYPGYLSFEDHLTSIYPFMRNLYLDGLPSGFSYSTFRAITSITFASSIPTDKDLIDLSLDGDGRVVGWISSDNVLTICTNEKKIKAPQNMFGFCEFYLKNIESIDFSSGLFDTSDTYSMAQAFISSSLTSFSFAKLDVRNVTDFSLMFCWCFSLASVDLSNVRSYSATSWDRYKKFLEKLDDENHSKHYLVSYFPAYRETLNEHISGAKGYVFFDGMFSSCRALEKITLFPIYYNKNIKISLGSSDGQQQYSTYGILSGCTALTTAYLTLWYSFKNVTGYNYLFYNCPALTTIEAIVDLYSTYEGELSTEVFDLDTSLVGNGISYDYSKVDGDALSFDYYLTERKYAVA